MIGKIRGFLILFVVFISLSGAAFVLAFVDTDRVWTSIWNWTAAQIPFPGGDGASSEMVSEELQMAQLFTDGAFEAIKSGRTGAGDVYEMGQLFYEARSDGHIDSEEFDRLFALAEKSGVVDAVIDKFLEPTDTARSSTPEMRKAQMQSLINDVRRARQSGGGLDRREIMTALNRARNAGLPGQIMEMLPPGYDQARAREIARDIAVKVARGDVPTQDMDHLFDTFMEAQADNNLDEKELDLLTKTARRISE